MILNNEPIGLEIHRKIRMILQIVFYNIWHHFFRELSSASFRWPKVLQVGFFKYFLEAPKLTKEEDPENIPLHK
jgi:hypothetical protein